MRADVDQEQNFRSAFGVFLFRKDNPTIVTGGTGVKARELSAQVMSLEAGIIDVLRHAAQDGFNLRLKDGILFDELVKRPFKPGCEDEFAHHSLGRAQAGNDAVGGLAFEFAVAKGFDGTLGFRCGFLSPCFDPTLAQQAFEHFLLV